MTARNQLVEAALSELERFGIKGEHVYRGKHEQVVWRTPEGFERSTIVASTTSDHRAWLNVRGEVRRSLRADHVELPAPDNVLSFKNAISLPKKVEPPNVKLARLEADFEVLLDWFIESRSQVEALQARLDSVQVTVSFGGKKEAPFPAVVQPTLSPPSRRRQGGPEDRVLSYLSPGGWLSTQAIRQETGLTTEQVGNTLHRLKVKGLVENGLRGMWRKKAG